ncbi:hypothetical protein [uncultured Tateyamaria sp.]|uniref:hypothetical protein n=1 Tax=uncultured Tateyamaria sp. TaxID=455651 RepID=UPI0026365165|nr:hypothetical protein [uncultured Tateyamaria sp.]
MVSKIKGALLGAATLLLATTNLSSAQTCALSTLNQGSVFHTAGTAIAKVTCEAEDLNMVVQPDVGTLSTQMSVNNALADFVIEDVNDVVSAVQGLGEYNAMPLENLGIVVNLRPLPIGLLVRNDSDITDIARHLGHGDRGA